ncbi:MAG TPA: carboxypeptidase-like regulatory domain-containing protein [Acidobacteriota bacterium]
MKKCISLTVIFSFLIALAPLAAATETKVGTLRGFVYGEDGKKPLVDAVVLIRETTTERTFQSEKTKKNGAYKIENLLPGTYAVGIQWDNKDFNVDVLVKIEPKKQMACFTLPKLIEKPGYQVRCKSPKCFFILPVGWALVAGATAGIIYGIIKVTEKAVSPTAPVI